MLINLSIRVAPSVYLYYEHIAQLNATVASRLTLALEGKTLDISRTSEYLTEQLNKILRTDSSLSLLHGVITTDRYYVEEDTDEGTQSGVSPVTSMFVEVSLDVLPHLANVTNCRLH